MTQNRHDFLRTGAAAAAAFAVPHGLVLPSAPTIDAPIGRYRRQTITTRERQITGVNEIGAGTMMPSLRVRDFKFASLSDAV
jgi:hypothetical protein